MAASAEAGVVAVSEETGRTTGVRATTPTSRRTKEGRREKEKDRGVTGAERGHTRFGTVLRSDLASLQGQGVATADRDIGLLP